MNTNCMTLKDWGRLHEAIVSIKDIQAKLTDTQRKELWDILQSKYCSDCGSPHLPCYCTRDD